MSGSVREGLARGGNKRVLCGGQIGRTILVVVVGAKLHVAETADLTVLVVVVVGDRGGGLLAALCGRGGSGLGLRCGRRSGGYRLLHRLGRSRSRSSLRNFLT